VREMRNAETVLSVIRDRGQRGLPLEDVYRQLFNPDLYLRAYGRISRNEGALTRGVTRETADGMSLEKIVALIDDVRQERVRWTPVRRTYLPKPNGKKRPLGIPTWKDKLLQEVMRSLLEAYYEPQFSPHSHGFRPGRGCHTALTEIKHVWLGTKWFVEADIRGCFDNIDHETLLSILGEKIHDNRFLRLLANLLQAGYLEEWRYRPTFSGTPQGGIISPLLANIYLDRLDQWVERTLQPEYHRGVKRRYNPVYRQWQTVARTARKRGDKELAKEAGRQQRLLPYRDPYDPDYRRLRYVRYADDFLLGFAGPKAEAEEIQAKLGRFLAEELKLELSESKTGITHATEERARFLGYEIAVQQCDTKRGGIRRTLNGTVALRVPVEVIEERCRRYLRHGKPIHRAELAANSDFDIVARYQAEYRGFVQYYLLAQNVARINKLRWIMETALLKTLANKHKSSVNQENRRLKATVPTEYGPRACLEVRVEREGKKALVARFGGIPLRCQTRATLQDQDLGLPTRARSELIQRLLAEECELCGSREKVEVHHIRKLADLQKAGRKEKPLHVRLMVARKRKSLIVCRECHEKIHAGRKER
jgi:group II intron reverse transcriptase/maturase